MERERPNGGGGVDTLVEIARFEEAAPEVVLGHLVRHYSLIHLQEVGVLGHKLVDGSRVQPVHLSGLAFGTVTPCP